MDGDGKQSKFDIGFWTSSAEDAFHEYLDDMVDHGYTEDEAKDLLQRIYCSVSEEYGM